MFKWFARIMQDDKGNPSSKRVATMLIVASFIIEWQHAIWTLGGTYNPNWTTVSLIAAALGITMFGKKYEETIDKPVQ